MENVIAITSPQKQAGKTTLALNLSALLANRGISVCLLELTTNRDATNYHFPTGGVSLSIISWLDIDNLSESPNGMLLKGLNGVYILPGPALPGQIELINKEFLTKTVGYLSNQFAAVVIDLEHPFRYKSLLKKIQTVMVVTTPETDPGMVSQFDAGNIFLVVNKAKRLDKRKFKALKPYGVLPDMAKLLEQSKRERPPSFPVKSKTKATPLKKVLGKVIADNLKIKIPSKQLPLKLPGKRNTTASVIETYSINHVIAEVKKAKRPVVVVDANYTNPSMAIALGVPTDEVWKYDWRTSRNIKPFQIEKGFDVCTLDPEIKGFDERDNDLLNTLTDRLLNQYRTVIVHFPNSSQEPPEEIQDLDETLTDNEINTSERGESVQQEEIPSTSYYTPLINATDHLTGCLNREAMDEILFKTEGTYSLVFCDLDNFKMVNDTYGHAAGDEILKEFAQFLLHSVRRSDYVFRYGGDEFVILLTDTGIDAARVVTQKLCNEWNAKKFAVIDNNSIIFSGGVAQRGLHGSTPGEVLKAADSTLYRVKRFGKGRVEIASLSKSPITKTNIELPDSQLVVICGDSTNAVLNILQNKIKKSLTIIDVDPQSNLAFKLGIEPNNTWKHDWRIGLAATPARINKKTCLFTMDKEMESELEERDIRSLKDIIKNYTSPKNQIIINAGNNQDIVTFLANMDNVKLLTWKDD